MSKNTILFNQMRSFISRYEFEKITKEHFGDFSVKSFKCWNLLQVMILTQLRSFKSLRDVKDSIKSKMNYWYHLGLKSISRNNLSHALMQRPSIIFEKMFYSMVAQLEKYRGLQSVQLKALINT